MIIERTKKEVIFKIPEALSVDRLQDIVDYLKYVEATRKSKASQKDVDELVKKIKKGRWAKTKRLISK